MKLAAAIIAHAKRRYAAELAAGTMTLREAVDLDLAELPEYS